MSEQKIMPGQDPLTITGNVTNIQNFCIHDGPGIRTTVFVKGCSLRCKWCSNPETIHPKPELAYNKNKCITEKECGLCLKVCPETALFVPEAGGKIEVNWDLCTNCGKCAEVCPPIALYMQGHMMTVEEVLKEVEKDTQFYVESGGGITVSGGECMLQPDFVGALLQEAHARGINTAVETASNVPYEFIQKVAPHVDTYLHDIKHMDPLRHKQWTGVDNKRILDNLEKLYTDFPDVKFIARTPVIPSVNDSEENIQATLDFILPHKNVVQYELLPYHRYGQNKYSYLGRK